MYELREIGGKESKLEKKKFNFLYLNIKMW